MAGEYGKAISIKAAIDAINSRDYLLPAIQRKFVWSRHQICVLFDSIMQEYPINSFLMWEIKDSGIKKDYKFYDFLKSYCPRFKEENTYVPTTASFKDFSAVIDGQQRLTSLYIGLCGTYADKKPRVWWPKTYDPSKLPPRKLYLNLKLEAEDDESLMRYNFKFLTDEEINASISDKNATHHWYCMHKILNLPDRDISSESWDDIINSELDDEGLAGDYFAHGTLSQLYKVIRSQETIHYFNEKSQKIDHVLNVFIRANSGGTELYFADLLMSIAVANWNGDFRQEVDDLAKQVHSERGGFYIKRDWILKTCLMLIDVDVRFKIKNFNAERVEKIQREWEGIRDCVKETFELIRLFGINSQSLTSTNAVIPICYYLYKHREGGLALYHSINTLAKNYEQRQKISQWFYMALLKGVFGGQADSILASMREVLNAHINEEIFPLNEIIDRYKATNKDLRFDEEYVQRMLDIQHGEGHCRALLHLLFPEKNSTDTFHIDHLHPKSAFERRKLKKQEIFQKDEDLLEFFSDETHWNSMANLHLLNASQNISKKHHPLKDWIGDQPVSLPADILVEGISLEFADFKRFFETRRSNLRKRLISRVVMSISGEPSPQDSDEEVVL